MNSAVDFYALLYEYANVIFHKVSHLCVYWEVILHFLQRSSQQRLIHAVEECTRGYCPAFRLSGADEILDLFLESNGWNPGRRWRNDNGVRRSTFVLRNCGTRIAAAVRAIRFIAALTQHSISNTALHIIGVHCPQRYVGVGFSKPYLCDFRRYMEWRSESFASVSD